MITIYRRYFRDSRCYQTAPCHTVRGVQVHSTGANNPWLRRYVQPDDGRIGPNANDNSHNGPGTVCANAYIGKQADGTVAIYQALPWNKRCWLSGAGGKGSANKAGFVGFEICEDDKTDTAYFYAVMDAAAKLTAYLCQEYHLNPDTDVKDHRELHDLGLASNHGDIGHWLKLYGRDMDWFRGRVKEYMAECVEATYIDCDEVKTMYQAKCVCPGTYLNLRKGPGTNYAAVEKIMRGDTADVLDGAAIQDWLYVSYKGKTGYAMAQYLERKEQGITDELRAIRGLAEEMITRIDKLLRGGD